MIVTEYYKTRLDGVKLFRTYSDEDFKIVQNETGEVYTEAIDVEGAPYTYTELNSGHREILETISPDKPFNKGDRGYWKGILYECILDNVTWNPDQFAAAWTRVPAEE